MSMINYDAAVRGETGHRRRARTKLEIEASFKHARKTTRIEASRENPMNIVRDNRHQR